MKHIPYKDASASHSPDWAVVCLNCGAPLDGPFCSKCGQRAVPPHPTTRELAGDAYEELVGWDGKFAQTIRVLLRRPGELTRALLDGRRAKYISPVRLYLMCSLVYFVLAAGVPLPDTTLEFDMGAGFGVDGTEPTAGDMAAAKAMMKGYATLTAEERALLEEEIATQPRLFQPMLRAMAQDYHAVTRRAAETMPRALFVLIPVLALILSLFYPGRHFPDHIYFAIHVQTFAFVALTAVTLIEYTRSFPLMAAAQAAAMLWIAVYGLIAMRRVYGGSWGATGLKGAGVLVLYGSLWSITVIGVTLWVSRAA